MNEEYNEGSNGQLHNESNEDLIFIPADIYQGRPAPETPPPSIWEKRWWSWPLLLTALLFYMEMMLRLFLYTAPFSPFIVLRILFFTACYAGVYALLTSIFTPRFNYWLSVMLMLALTVLFLAQYIYFLVFRTPMLAFSIFNGGQVMEFADQVWRVVTAHLPQTASLLLPLLILLLLRPRRRPRPTAKPLLLMLLMAAACFGLGLWSLDGDDASPASAYSCYYNENNPPPTQQKLGMLTFMRLDTQRLLFGFLPKDAPIAAAQPEPPIAQAEPETVYPPNMLDIDFAALIEQESDEELLSLHQYFASRQPSAQNEYTGLFAGCDLILITAEGFSHYLLDTGMFPTLSRLATEGFEFSNFYTPLWNVSTSDGEYTVLTGLIPKSGVWSMSASSDNYLPFALANQLSGRGYANRAYHNHFYGYYDRQYSHPNLGYEYKAKGKGLNVSDSWPESDVEMMQLSAPDFLDEPRFNVYYLTVSGHLEYNFGGNNMAARHREEVAELPYSDEVRAYIACNLELEKAMAHLLTELEAAGRLENTVIALSSDHYPYGLSDDALNELAGHTVERNFELYQNTFILWKQGQEHQLIEEPCCSLDILPTLSNLFALPFDSRLMMGRDIFADTPPLVIFNNRSWITDQARYSVSQGQAEGDVDQSYVDAINQAVNAKFTYSALMLDNDYYRVIFPENIPAD